MKHLVNLDEEALAEARAALGTRTIKDTVNTALAMAAASGSRATSVATALDTLSFVEFTDSDRAAAWH